MKAGKPSTVEVRLAKTELRALAESMRTVTDGDGHGMAPSSGASMSVKLRAPDGGFIVDSSSPETQWADSPPGSVDHDFTRWRWTVTPLRSGHRGLLLSASVRSSGAAAIDQPLPEQTVAVRVSRNYGRLLLRILMWLIVAACGGTLAFYGQAPANALIGELMNLLK